MQVRKTYRGVNPELLYGEVKDFIANQGLLLADSKMETFAMPDDSSTFIFRGTLNFHRADGQECLRAHIVGSTKTETKLMLDIADGCFAPEKVAALQSDIDFIFGVYEVGAK